MVIHVVHSNGERELKGGLELTTIQAVTLDNRSGVEIIIESNRSPAENQMGKLRLRLGRDEVRTLAHLMLAVSGGAVKSASATSL